MRNFLRHSLLLVLALLMAVPLPALALLWEGNGAGRFYEVGADGEAMYYHYDNVGSTIALSNEAGVAIERMEYEPYGTLVHRAREAGFEGGLHDTAYLFAGFYGYQTDSSGLVYLRERYYNPLTRRFINPDPAREGWNWYAYAGGDPMGFVDPSGLGTESVLDAVQTGLSALGMMPIVGAAFDILNAGISFVSGQHVAALMNLASAVPGLGDAFAAGKMAFAGAKVAAASFGAGMAAFGKVGGGVKQLNYIPTSGTLLRGEIGKTTTIIGSYHKDMKHVISEMGNVKSLDFGAKPGGFNVLNAPDSLFKSPSQFWSQYNKPWLAESVRRGDNIIFATTPKMDVLTRVNPITGKLELSGFGKEYLFLRKNGMGSKLNY